jgi:hypothetical protein
MSSEEKVIGMLDHLVWVIGPSTATWLTLVFDPLVIVSMVPWVGKFSVCCGGS